MEEWERNSWESEVSNEARRRRGGAVSLLVPNPDQ